MSLRTSSGIPAISVPLLPQRENLEMFLKGCESYGLKSQDLFQVNDLYENKNLYMVSKEKQIGDCSPSTIGMYDARIANSTPFIIFYLLSLNSYQYCFNCGSFRESPCV